MCRSQKLGRLLFCILVFAAVYPLVTGLSYLMQQSAENWSLWQRHLVIVPIIVLAMVFVIIPKISTVVARSRCGERPPAVVSTASEDDA